MPHGPQRVILINAGKYDFAEVELEGALQIVGPNNTGKTTLINTLQFLYINDQREMDFGAYTKEQTRDFYFRNQYSYILFECLSTRGQCVIGWRGQSRASGNDPERFYYQGPYAADDFFDEKGQVREPRDVNARLALRQYEKITTQQQHRELLLNPAGGNTTGLGIVSLKDPDKYPHFRETLKNLLSLSTLTQEQMRERLLMLADISPDSVAVDAREIFGQHYDDIRRRRESLRRFKEHAEDIGRLVDRFHERESLRGEQIHAWSLLRVLRQEFESRHEEQLAAIDRDLQAADEALRSSQAELGDRRRDAEHFTEERGRLKGRLDELEKRGIEFADFIEEMERSAMGTLEQEVKRLQRHIEDAAAETREKADAKIQLYADKVQKDEQFIAGHSRSVLTALRQRFKDEELDRLFRLLDFDLLTLPIGPDGVEVLDAKALQRLLEDLVGATRESGYRDHRVAIAFRRGSRSVADIADLEKVRTQLAEDEQTLRRWRQILRSIQDRESQQQSLRDRLKQLEEKRHKLIRWEQLALDRAQEPRVSADLGAVEQSIQAAQSKIEALEKRILDWRGKLHKLETAKVAAENAFNQVMGRFNQCRFPSFSAPAAVPADPPQDFDSGIETFLRAQEREGQVSEEVTRSLHDAERHFGEEYFDADEGQTARNLQAELEALADKEEALQRDWNAHIHGLKGAFDNVLAELGHVRTAADQLNRQFGRIQVSNLKSLHVDIREQSDIVTWIRRLAEMEQPSLFDADTRLEPTLRNFRQKLESNPIIRFGDLFTLEFRIVGDDDASRSYHDFKQIESHGTTITIKVLFNLLVLKSLLRKDDSSVPFFLDEIQALDPANRRAILTTARKLGFVAITAAPESVTEVDALYFLQPHKGRVVLKHKHRLQVRLQESSAS
ncbi:MAG: hypothetical protein HY299_05240 [Verrucomicrobia bacterium]|nr:hypothetical protein [Verrucomicrobiota bacterium]